jgi:hypothetical protein
MLGDLAHKFWDITPASIRSCSVQSCDVAACLVIVSGLDLLSLASSSRYAYILHSSWRDSNVIETRRLLFSSNCIFSSSTKGALGFAAGNALKYCSKGFGKLGDERRGYAAGRESSNLKKI